MRGIRIFAGIILMCLCICTFAEENDIYSMGPDDAFYHLDCGCGETVGDMYLVSLEAAKEFWKLPCPKCAGEVEVVAQNMGEVTVVKAEGPENTEISMANALFEREIGGAKYFVLKSDDMDGAKVTVSRGVDLQEISAWETTQNKREAVVSIDRNNGAEEFRALDVFGLRLCSYAASANENLVDAQVCLLPQGEEIFGEVSYELALPVRGFEDRGIAHYWLLTQDEFARMDGVTIAGEGKSYSGDVRFDPFFTGENPPEAVDGVEGWQIGMNGATVKKGYKDISKVEKEDDFCGLYLGSSGHYVVSVKNPTKKRARQYAKIVGGDIWVVQGEYTRKEMNKARKNAEKIVEPDFASSSINPVTNRVEIEVCGADIARYADRELFDPCVNVTYEGEYVWDRGAMAAQKEDISRPPISQTEVMGIKAYMEREEYPVGAEYISFCIENEAEFCAISLVGTLEKYSGEAWKKVAGDYLQQFGRTLKDAFEMPRTIITPGMWSYRIPTGNYEQLGEGLYRLTAFKIGENDAVIEFAVTEKAVPMEDYADKRPDFAMPSPSAHMPSSSAPGYSSLTDDYSMFSAGGWEFRLIWLPEELWDGNLNRVTAIVAWPEGRPHEAVKIYEAAHDAFRMFNAGDGIVILGSTNIIRMDYDGDNVETLVTGKKGIKQALMLDGDVYYMTDAHLWRYSGGEKEKIWSPKKGTGETLEYYDNKMYATNGAGKTVEIDISK